MYGNTMINSPLINSFNYRNKMNNMNQNLYYQHLNNQMPFNPMMNNYFPLQMYQNNFVNYQIPFLYNKNVFMNYNANKFNVNHPNRIQKPLFSKNNKIKPDNEYNGLKNEETSLEEKEIKLKNRKKYSIDSTDSNKTSSNISNEEINDLEEKNDEDKESSKINLSENLNINKENKYVLSKGKKGGRRNSNISKVSDCSKCSKSTNCSTTTFINEKDVSEEATGKFTNSGKYETEKKNESCSIEKYQGNPDFENTVILNVNVKISKDKTAVFRLKRYDDLFLTIKLFCEINSIDEKLMKPLIIKSLTTLNTIYQVMNSKLDNEEINILKEIKEKKL